MPSRILCGSFVRRTGIAIAAGCSLYLGAVLQGAALAQVGMDAVQAEKTVTLAIANEPPWMKLEPDGSATGIGPDVDRAALEQMGVETVKGQIMEYGTLVPSVQARRVTLVTSGGLWITPERCKAVLFSEPVFCNGDAFIVRKDLADRIDTYQEVLEEGLRIGVCAGCVWEKHAADIGISEDKIVRWPDGTSGMKMLQDGRIDVLVHEVITASHLQDKSGSPEMTALTIVTDRAPGCSGAIFTKQDADLRDAYNAGLAKIVEDGTFAEILGKYDVAALADARTTRTTAEICAGG